MRERGSKGASLHASNRSCWFSSRRTQLWPQITSADKFDFPNNKLILACKIGDFLNHTSRGSIFCIGATWSNQQFSNLIPVILASQNDLSNPLSDPNQQTNALSSSSPNSRRYFLRRTEVGCTWPSSRYKMTWRGWSLDSTWKSYCLDPRWFVWPHFGQLTVLLFRASVFKWAVKVLVQLESHSQWWIQFQYCSCFHYIMVSALCLAVFILPHIGCMIQIDSEFSWFNFFQLDLAGCAPWGSKWRAALGKSRIPSFWDVEHEMWTVSLFWMRRNLYAGPKSILTCIAEILGATWES